MTYNPDELHELAKRESKRLHPSTRSDVRVSRETFPECERCGHPLTDHTVEETASNHIGNLFLGPGALLVCCIDGCICYEVRTRSWDVT